MPDLRNVRILRSQDVGVDHSEDERPTAYIGARDVVDRRKGTSFMSATDRQRELDVYMSGRSHTIWGKLHPGLDSNGRLRPWLRERHPKQRLRIEVDVEVLWNLGIHHQSTRRSPYTPKDGAYMRVVESHLHPNDI